MEDMSTLDDTLTLEDMSALDDTLALEDISTLDDTLTLDDTSSMDDLSSLDAASSPDAGLSLEPVAGSENNDALLSDGTETGAEEPVLNDISLDDDMNLDADNFTTDSVTAESNDFANVIPEAFETGSGDEANIPLDDDMEVFIDEDIPLDELGDESKKEESLAAKAEKVNGKEDGLSTEVKEEVKKVLSYMDHLLESLPEDKIEEFAKSEHFDTYKKLFKDLGLV